MTGVILVFGIQISLEAKICELQRFPPLAIVLITYKKHSILKACRVKLKKRILERGRLQRRRSLT